MPVDEEVESQHMKFIQSPPRKFLMLQEHQGGCCMGEWLMQWMLNPEVEGLSLVQAVTSPT